MPSPNVYRAPNPQTVFGFTPLGFVSLEAGKTQLLNSLILPAMQGVQSDTQSIFCDASAAQDAVIVRNQQTRQYVVFPAGHIGWLPLLLTQPGNLEAVTASDAEIYLGVATSIVPPHIYNAGFLRSSANVSQSVVTASVTSQLFLDANPERQGVSIYNDSPNAIYLLIGTGTASASNFSVLIPALGYFETPYKCGAELNGVWNAAVGGARITEFL